MPAAAAEAPITPTAIFMASDYATLSALYDGVADKLAGSVVLAPLDKRGRPVWKGITSDELMPAVGPASDWPEAERRGVLISNLGHCNSDTAMVLFWALGCGDTPILRQIAGPEEDRLVAIMLILRQLGLQPRMEPVLPREPIAAPEADNDNREVPQPPAMHPSPFDAGAAGGLLAETARWITAAAILPVPELSLAAAIALMAGLYGGKCLGPTSSGVNVFMTTMLQTAGGKGHPPKAIRALADQIGGTHGAVSNGDHTSYAAFERTLRRNPSTVAVMDEFGLTLQDVNAKNRNSVAASIRKFLLAIYDQANSVFDGRIYASGETKGTDEPIRGPALTVLAMTTPDTLYEGLHEGAIRDGFLNRFVFFTGSARGEAKPPRLMRDHELPRELVEMHREALLAFPANKGVAVLKKVVLPFEGGEEGEAYQHFAQIFLWQHHGAWSEVERNINGRAAENSIRLATLRAISRNPVAPVVSVQDMEWGWALVHRSIELIGEGARRHMASTPAEALRKKVLDVMRKHEKALPYSKLLTKHGVSGADTKQLEEALTWLIESGQITDTAARGKPGRGSSFRLN